MRESILAPITLPAMEPRRAPIIAPGGPAIEEPIAEPAAEPAALKMIDAIISPIIFVYM
jgi:hypothetical protein